MFILYQRICHELNTHLRLVQVANEWQGCGTRYAKVLKVLVWKVSTPGTKTRTIKITVNATHLHTHTWVHTCYTSPLTGTTQRQWHQRALQECRSDWHWSTVTTLPQGLLPWWVRFSIYRRKYRKEMHYTNINAWVALSLLKNCFSHFLKKSVHCA